MSVAVGAAVGLGVVGAGVTVVVGAGAALVLNHLFGPAPAIIGAGLAGAAVAALVHRSPA